MTHKQVRAQYTQEFKVGNSPTNPVLDDRVVAAQISVT